VRKEEKNLQKNDNWYLLTLVKELNMIKLSWNFLIIKFTFVSLTKNLGALVSIIRTYIIWEL